MFVDFMCVCGERGLCDYCQDNYGLWGFARCYMCDGECPVMVDHRTDGRTYLVCDTCGMARPTKRDEVEGSKCSEEEIAALWERLVYGVYNMAVILRLPIQGKLNRFVLTEEEHRKAKQAYLASLKPHTKPLSNTYQS